MKQKFYKKGLTNNNKGAIINISKQIKKEKVGNKNMKVNYNADTRKIKIVELTVGETFLARRKGIDEQALYIKIDGNSGLIKAKCNSRYAVNLSTGQLREFASTDLVERRVAEVNLIKY